ncbi:glycogen/starch/alpha-glucan phosphorylase [Aliifodinibius sp. S!AR15-10]|uniref:glycogen/starch/alpha-glucan phosphorylase n=1 Tax=Aliifodinibius sp. S!AR15-10 TaxID=2950437 RepID=UPI0028566109|nr:glycogen/starch/alpha-glucan phosphorylase [Aliifodinibius sp. S!AR15-10]MDR8391527.1 glycogen/starch/alpha-glucan phosphorylase [Aliifodinibius sp. S!AR15-10]
MNKKVTDVDPRTGMDVESFKQDIQQHLYYTLAKDKYSSTEWDIYRSVVISVMDRLHDRWIDTQQTYYKQDVKRVYYLSMEYLIGRLLDSMLINLGMQEEAAQAFEEMGLDYDKIREVEVDAGLGNGGLGRLAACYLDSMATLGIPSIGYGIRYDYGIFDQEIEDGWQIEKADLWLQYGYPWSLVRPKVEYPVQFYGESVSHMGDDGELHFEWKNTHDVLAVAYDTPVPGYKNDIVNHLRLWKATASHEFDLKSFNQGDYIDAVRDNMLEENISRVLYPNDKVFKGQELRLKQEYFLVSASVQDAIRRFKKQHDDFRKLPDKVAFQCNDTHPNLAVPELMRILMDIEGLNWDTSWEITSQCINYTNHTLMPEALEKWPISLMENLLPRHTQIIHEINRRFMNEIRANFPDDEERVSRMRIVGEEMNPVVHMGPLGIVAANKVNGVSKIHSDLMKKTIFKDYAELYPDKFTNVTNGITPRRWLKQCNPGLANLITDRIGDEWLTNLDQLQQVEQYAEDADFQEQFDQIKRENKKRLGDYIKKELDIDVNPDSIFDIQIKRIHEYKRQLMAALHVITLYNRIKENPDADVHPRTVIFGGKAAPGYTTAKQHIKLINNIGRKVNNDPEVGDKLKCIFLPNYRVSLAEKMIPAADLSEQISTAGMEASGTGNMKFALNGALTIGTLDGANIEIRNQVGDENIFIFGLEVEDIEKLRHEGYNPIEYYKKNKELKKALDQIREGFFSPEDKDLFQPIINNLLHHGDYFMVLADYESYVEKQEEVEQVYRDKQEWYKRAIINVANMGFFSSDRSIQDYAERIWDIEQVEK